MYNIIFLDVDGVLNGYNKLNVLGWDIACKTKCKKIQNWYRNLTDPCGVHEAKIKRLAKIVHSTNSKVVMSSCWRHSFWNVPYEEKTDRQKKLTDLLKKYNIEVIDITPRSHNGRREDEIICWLSKKEEKVKSFIILDDESADLECFKNSNLIQTVVFEKNTRKKLSTGLNDTHVKTAIDYLNNKKEARYVRNRY